MTQEPDVNPEHDDHLLVATRALALVIIPVLTAAFVILFGFPSRTKQLWAWAIRPDLSALIMGAAYLTGAWFFARTILDGRWHRVSLGWLAVIPFTTLLGIATLLHWEKFNHDHVSFWGWLILYTVTPIALPLLWWRNNKAAGRAKPSGPQLPNLVRVLVAGSGAMLLATACAIFLRPRSAITRWPWTLTPLTARTLASFAVFLGVVWLAFAVTSQWNRVAIPFEATALGLLMVVVATIRGHNDLVPGTGQRVFVGLLAVAAFASLGLLVWAARRYRHT